MGLGSKWYFQYYALAAVVYLGVMACGFFYTTTYLCNQMCPMIIPVSQQGIEAGLDYSQCLCTSSTNTSINPTGHLNATGYPYDPNNPTFPATQPSEEAAFNRYRNVFAITGPSTNPTGLNCYICSSDTLSQVYEPCDTYAECTTKGIEGFRPATLVPNAYCNTNTAPVATITLGAPSIVDRAQVNTLILALACLFLIQTVTAMITAYAYFRFKDKYGSDWQKLSTTEQRLGVAAKVLPPIARLANLASLIILALASNYFFGSQVCLYDMNEFGLVTFAPAMMGYLLAMIVVWLFFCLVGGCFHWNTPRDTSFYNPKFPDEPGEGCCKRFVCKVFDCVTTFGP